jgi:acyl carrier protein
MARHRRAANPTGRAANGSICVKMTIADMTDLKRKLKELLIERLKFEDMTPDDIGDDEPLFAGGLGLDSIDALEIVVMLESEFGIKVKNEVSARDHFRSISTLAAYVGQKIAQEKSA